MYVILVDIHFWAECTDHSALSSVHSVVSEVYSKAEPEASHIKEVVHCVRAAGHICTQKAPGWLQR